MSAKKFLEVAEKSGLLEQTVLAELRRQVADGKGKVSAESIANTLVKKGHLTKFQATKLVGEATAAPEEKSDPRAARKKDEPRKTEEPQKAEDDLLGLAPLDDEAEPAPAAPAKRGSAPKATEDEEVVLLEDAGGLTPVEDAGAALTPLSAPQPAFTPFPAEPASHDPFGGSGLGGVGLGEAGTPDPFATATPAGATQPGYMPKKKQQQWDTKLMLGGSLALLIMLIVGAGLLWNILAVPAVEMFEAAEKSYREQAYADAKEKFEKFLENYPKDESAGKARIRVFLCRIRQDIGDPERALTTAKEVLPEIAKEKDADMAREEFPLLLPQIPEGFVGRAKAAKETKAREDLLAKAKESMVMVSDPENIPTSRRTAILPQLNRISEDIILIERSILQDKELVAAIGAIGKAEEAGDTVQAFQLYNDLLRRYPGVRDDVSLGEAVAKIVARERSLVKVVDEALTPVTADTARTSEFRVVLANRTGGGESKPQNPAAVILARGSAFGLDAGNGQLLWSRFVGYATRSHPVRVSQQADSDLLLVDGQRNELLRVKARTGELVWRVSFGESFAEPAVSGPRVYVAARSGKLWELDAATGAAQRHVQLPQKLFLAPAAAADQPYLVQVGEHSNVYVLNADSLQCEDVLYLGHKAGTIEVPPLLLMGHVFIAENVRAESARVHALKMRGTGAAQKLTAVQEPILTPGRIVVPLVVYSRRLLILSDRGDIRVFDVDKTKNENSVTDTGKLPSTLSEPQIGYPLAEGTTLWVADNKLTKYMVQVTRKEITRDPAITSVGDTFVAPLQLFGNQLVHARRAAGSTGVTVACIAVDNPRQVVWQTQLGVPAGRIVVNPATNEILAISSAAALFQINGEVLKNGYSDTPLLNVGGAGALSFTTPIDFEKDVVAFFNPADHKQLLVYDPAAGATRLRIVSLPVSGSQLACPPVAFLGGLLLPLDSGTLQLVKLADGSPQVQPFQPKLEAGEKIQWKPPAVIGPEGRELVVVDDRKNIYRVGVKDQPAPHLAELATNRLDVELASGLAAVGDSAYGVVRTSGGDALVAISPSDLKVGKEFDLKGGRVTWGPERVGEWVLVVTDEKELRCFGAGQQERWEKPAIMLGQPAGRPLVDGDDYIFASVGGAVWRIRGASGDVAAKAELGEPLGAGPVAFRGRLLLCGSDGALHVIPMPTASAGG